MTEINTTQMKKSETVSPVKLIWLFSRTDLHTKIIPDTIFGILGALSGPLLTSNPNHSSLHTLLRTPLVLLWVWSNVLVFEISNQRLPNSVAEDRINKPWRPLATGLWTEDQARRNLSALMLVTLATGYALGVGHETALLFTGTWINNDLRAGEENFIVRNLLVASAYILYLEGALTVACGFEHGPRTTGYVWVVILGLTVLTTIHGQDMYDQEEDREKGRSTAALILGDRPARWSLIVAVAFWSFFCPLYWRLPPVLWLPSSGLGGLAAFRRACYSQPREDFRTYVCWAAWLITLYILPVARRYI
jgi:4-hydroxybenzoate polyprenyltransferase